MAKYVLTQIIDCSQSIFATLQSLNNSLTMRIWHIIGSMRVVKTIILLMLLDINVLAFANNDSYDRALVALKKYSKTSERWHRQDFEYFIAKAAEEGDADAQYLYYRFATHEPYKGWTYSDIELSDSLAYIYIQRSADQNNILAIGELGLLLDNPPQKSKIERDERRSFELLKIAEKTNNPQIDLLLGWHYCKQKLYDMALSSFECAMKHGGKEFEWKSLDGLAYTNYKKGNYKSASVLYQKWFAKAKKENHLQSEHKWEKLSPFFHYPQLGDYIYAIESFYRERNFSELNLIPYLSYKSGNVYYRDSDVKFDLTKWSSDDSDYLAKIDLLDLIEYILLVHYNYDSEFIANIHCLHLIYSSYNNPKGYHCFTRSLYYNKLGDIEKEHYYLSQGAKDGNVDCSLKLATMYYYGVDGSMVDKHKAFNVLYPIKEQLNKRMTGSDYAKLSYMLAMLYYSKEIQEFSYEKAIEYALKFLEAKDYVKLSIRGDIYRLLAVCYRFGRGAEVNEELSMEYSKLAAEYGNTSEAEILDWLQGNNDTDKSSFKEDFH